MDKNKTEESNNLGKKSLVKNSKKSTNKKTILQDFASHEDELMRRNHTR